WAYDLCMTSEWNEAVASMMIKNWVASLQTIGEVYRQPTANEISEPSNIFVNGASMMIKHRVASLQTIGEVYRQPTADEISEPSNIFVDGASLKAKSVSWSTTSTVSQHPVRLKMEDTGEVHLRALREQFEPASQVHQKHADIGKDKPRKLSEDDFPRLRQAWQQEFVDIVNGTKEELPP
ncbi:hypothetical protein C0995_003649, partial [Termitomyces sp. Mi166